MRLFDQPPKFHPPLLKDKSPSVYLLFVDEFSKKALKASYHSNIYIVKYILKWQIILIYFLEENQH